MRARHTKAELKPTTRKLPTQRCHKQIETNETTCGILTEVGTDELLDSQQEQL